MKKLLLIMFLVPLIYADNGGYFIASVTHDTTTYDTNQHVANSLSHNASDIVNAVAGTVTTIISAGPTYIKE